MVAQSDEAVALPASDLIDAGFQMDQADSVAALGDLSGDGFLDIAVGVLTQNPVAVVSLALQSGSFREVSATVLSVLETGTYRAPCCTGGVEVMAIKFGVNLATPNPLHQLPLKRRTFRLHYSLCAENGTLRCFSASPAGWASRRWAPTGPCDTEALAPACWLSLEGNFFPLGIWAVACGVAMPAVHTMSRLGNSTIQQHHGAYASSRGGTSNRTVRTVYNY